jgi:hypothetical protein
MHAAVLTLVLASAPANIITAWWFDGLHGGPEPQTCYAPRFGCYPGATPRHMHRYPAFHAWYYRRPYNYRHLFDYPWHAALHEPTSLWSYNTEGGPPLDGQGPTPADCPPGMNPGGPGMYGPGPHPNQYGPPQYDPAQYGPGTPAESIPGPPPIPEPNYQGANGPTPGYPQPTVTAYAPYPVAAPSPYAPPAEPAPQYPAFSVYRAPVQNVAQPGMPQNAGLPHYTQRPANYPQPVPRAAQVQPYAPSSPADLRLQ